MTPKDYKKIPPRELVQRLCDKAFLIGVDGAPRGEVDVWLICEAYQAGYEQHEKELLDALHAVVPQPYKPEAE
jgi:hypothetical protein